MTNSDSTTVTVLLRNEAATFAEGTPIPVGIAPQDLVAGDFNGDGRTDLAVANNGPLTPHRTGVRAAAQRPKRLRERGRLADRVGGSPAGHHER